MAGRPAPRRFTVGEFVQMGAAGIPTDDDRVELLVREVFQPPRVGSWRAAELLNSTALRAAGLSAPSSRGDPPAVGADLADKQLALLLRGDFPSGSLSPPVARTTTVKELTACIRRCFAAHRRSASRLPWPP
ncbi:MAG: hypothetical protein IT307_10580 [Chloroflexi bacterium]|nr:hypothetical protein [Chloroflexota bacterium]